MKKTLPRKKLQLRRATIATLAGPALEIVVGGITGGVTVGITVCAGITSVADGDKVVLCNIPLTEG